MVFCVACGVWHFAWYVCVVLTSHVVFSIFAWHVVCIILCGMCCVASGMVCGLWHLAWHMVCGNLCGIWCLGFCVACDVWHFVWHVASCILRGMWCVAFCVACGVLH